MTRFAFEMNKKIVLFNVKRVAKHEAYRLEFTVAIYASWWPLSLAFLSELALVVPPYVRCVSGATRSRSEREKPSRNTTIDTKFQIKYT